MTEAKILGKYKFHYPESNVTQEKILIPASFWLYATKKELDALVGDNQWFTDNSPLYHAIGEGYMTLKNRVYIVEATKIE